MKRHEMSDEQWNALEPLLPVNTGRGRRWTDHRTVINGILWVLNTGAAWCDIPERFGSWQTIYHRFNTWTKDGTWHRMSFRRDRIRNRHVVLIAKPIARGTSLSE